MCLAHDVVRDIVLCTIYNIRGNVYSITLCNKWTFMLFKSELSPLWVIT